MSLDLGAIDRPHERKVSVRANIPRWGGIAVALGCFVGLAVSLLMLEDRVTLQADLEPLVAGGLLVLTIGALDDRWSLPVSESRSRKKVLWTDIHGGSTGDPFVATRQPRIFHDSASARKAAAQSVSQVTLCRFG
jgi:hypothetical protein